MGLTKRQKEELKRKRNFTCEYCGRKYDPDFLVIHHKITRPEWQMIRGTIQKERVERVPQDWISELLWGARWRKVITTEEDPDYDKESNLLVLCVKDHKLLDKVASHGKIHGKRKRETPSRPSVGFTGKDVYDVVFGKKIK